MVELQFGLTKLTSVRIAGGLKVDTKLVRDRFHTLADQICT